VSLMRVISFVPILMTLLPTSVVRGAQCTTNYQNLLYPSGLPVSGHAGNGRPAQFKCYAETPLASDTKAVVFSEKTSSGSLDAVYKVKLAVVSVSDSGLHLLLIHEITASIPVQLEIPGNFYEMNAVAETLRAHDEVQLLHINLWAVLSGSGAISGGSDLFYAYQSRRLSGPLLEIPKTSSFSKENINNMSKRTSELFLSNQNTETFLFVITREVKVEDSIKSISGPRTAVYLLHRDRFELTNVSVQLPSGALPLQRVEEISKLDN
jgi:hypothetical protein